MNGELVREKRGMGERGGAIEGEPCMARKNMSARLKNGQRKKRGGKDGLEGKKRQRGRSWWMKGKE